MVAVFLINSPKMPLNSCQKHERGTCTYRIVRRKKVPRGSIETNTVRYLTLQFSLCYF